MITMEYDVFRRSQFKDDDGKVQPAEKLGVFVAEDGADIAVIQQYFRSGDFAIKPKATDKAPAKKVSPWQA